MNAWRVPYEAHTSVVRYASEGSALRRSMWRNYACLPEADLACQRTCSAGTSARRHGLQPVEAPLERGGAGKSFYLKKKKGM
jgi:hypothetical protein